MNEDKKSYYAIIPASVRYDKNLMSGAKLLYGEITALCNEKGYCWASNSYFAELYGVSHKSISVWIKCLCNAGYIKAEMDYQKGGKGGTARILKIEEDIDAHGRKGEEPREENLHNPLEENVKHNNTVINNTIKKENNKRKIFDETSDPYLLARLLETDIREHSPHFPESEEQRQRWAKDIDLMIRKDKLDVDVIAEVIEWCQQDSFWRSNILSGKKLREKYLQLSIRMSNNKR